jgi:hypothetical protein
MAISMIMMDVTSHVKLRQGGYVQEVLVNAINTQYVTMEY